MWAANLKSDATLVRSVLMVVLLGVFLNGVYNVALAFEGPDERNDGEKTGKFLYESNCSVCHQLDGGGVPMMQPELFAIERATGPVGGIIDMILKGSEAVEPGTSDFSNEMPAFTHLTDNEIAAIAPYVRENFESRGGAVTSAQVKFVRDQYK